MRPIVSHACFVSSGYVRSRQPLQSCWLSVSLPALGLLVLETIAPAWLACGQLDTVCAWRVAASGG